MYNTDHKRPGGAMPYGICISIDLMVPVWWMNRWTPNSLPQLHLQIDGDVTRKALGFCFAESREQKTRENEPASDI